ncbi:hypothetical protein NONO_c16920 [Nocardia nova SH22a]|uniref:DUF397 domain-containing protein n=1 Tax=Nocardia nova SH22a TaxID=1415166 RepID=W5TC01_9NOCA|nr:DUF397 domain-containing protein [Nocardia nova]AHH16493.1 hypothetical protein NONO_c16920 [Nocardia nova SH22a]
MNADLSGAHWFTSSHSGGGQECVEVAFLSEGFVGVRDSKDRTGPALIFTPSEWDAFTSAVGTDGFNRSA